MPWCVVLVSLVLLAGPAGAQEMVLDPQREKQVGEDLKKFSHRVVDRLQNELDEWGSVSMAPLIFAPPTTASGAKSFQMGGSRVTFDNLYDEYNNAQGQSLFGERTLFKASAEYTVNRDDVARDVQTAKLDVLKANTSNAIVAQQTKQDDTKGLRDEAKQRLDDAKTADKAADAKLAAARARYDLALNNKVAATARVSLETVKVPQDDKALYAARVAEIDAVKEEAIAKYGTDSAQTEKGVTAKALSEAQGTYDTAKTNYDTAVTAPIAEPTTTQTNGGTGSGTTPPTTTPATPIQTSQPGTSALDTLGANALPNPFVTKQADGKTNPPGGVFSPMARINAAASTMAVYNILNFLGNPEAALQFRDKRILFAVSSVSVNPGWRTKRDFKGSISARMTCALVSAHAETIREMLRSSAYPLGLRKAIADAYPAVLSEEERAFFEGVTAFTPTQQADWLRGNPQDSSPGIVVSAVSPMVDAQTLDLASSIARQDELALSLAANLASAGASQAGKFFTSWSRMRRKDVATKSTVAVNNSIILGGGYFGFEIGTRLRGLDDDDARGNKAAQTLDRQTFPILLILGMSDDDAKPRIIVDDKGITIKEPEVQISYSSHWSPVGLNMLERINPWRAKRPPSDGYAEVIDFGVHQHGLPPELKTNSGYKLNRALSDARSNISREYEALGRQLHGADINQQLPAKWMLDSNADDTQLHNPEVAVAGPSVQFAPATLVFPALNTLTTVVLQGAGMAGVDPARIEVIGNSIKKVNATSLGADAIAVQLELQANAGTSMQFVLPHRVGRKNAITNPLSYTLLSTSAAPSVEGWTQGPFLAVGTENAGKWSGTLDLTIRGERLTELQTPQLLPAGQGSATIVMATDKLLTVRVEFNNLAAANGQAAIEFAAAGRPVKLYTAPFVFRLVK